MAVVYGWILFCLTFRRHLCAASSRVVSLAAISVRCLDPCYEMWRWFFPRCGRNFQSVDITGARPVSWGIWVFQVCNGNSCLRNKERLTSWPFLTTVRRVAKTSGNSCAAKCTFAKEYEHHHMRSNEERLEWLWVNFYLNTPIFVLNLRLTPRKISTMN